MNHPSSTASQWFASGDERLSLDDFRRLMAPYLSAIEQRSHMLQGAYSPFETSRGVLPFQCRKAIHHILALNTEICQFRQFLRDTPGLPIVIMALRYQLLNTLHYLKEQVDKLLSYLYDMNSSPPCLSLREYIRDLFCALFLLLADISQQASFLLDEARFQEKRLVPTSS